MKTLSRLSQRGNLLAEMCIAMLVLAMAVSAIAGTMLTNAKQSGRLRRREQALLAKNQLLQALQNYVTADASPATRDMAPDNCWNLIDPSGGQCPSGWAFDPGVAHDAQFFLPGSLREAPFNGTMTYTVSIVNEMPTVAVDVHWTEPEL